MAGFFESEDFRNTEFRALIPKYYPPEYKKYISIESKLIKSRVRNSKLLEAGVGIGRLIPVLAPVVKEFVGIDNSDFMVRKSLKVGKGYRNTRIIKLDIEKVEKLFSQNYFDYTTLVWNTLGNVKNELAVLKALSKVTKKSIFVTVFLKGTLEKREQWYKGASIKIIKIDIQL